MSVQLQDIAEHYHQHSETYPEPFRLRIHRSLSWLKRAMRDEGGWVCENLGKPAERAKLSWDKLPVDWDVRFIALWIAFNAAYANEIDGRNIAADKSDLRSFLQIVCRLDVEKQIHQLVWKTFSGSIRLLLETPYTFQAFWDAHNGKISQEIYVKNFARAKKKAQEALFAQHTDMLLIIVFDRLYTLRNQIIHGGATFNSSANRQQIQDACAILGQLIPIILHIMLCYPHEDWGNPFYPFIEKD